MVQANETLISNQDRQTNQVISTEKSTNAIVIGASITGLLAARVLVNHFEKVTIIERDFLPQEPKMRLGAHQSMHVHALLTRGEQILEQLFPGIGNQLSEAGALSVDWIRDWSIFGSFGESPRFDSGLIGHAVSRILLEWQIRQRLSDYDNLQILDRSQLVEFLTNKDKSKIKGVKLRSRRKVGQETHYQLRELNADLVVDTTGRSSLTPKYLANLGYQPPQESIINSYLGYASRWYEQPKDFKSDWKGLSVLPKPPDNPRAGYIYPIEGNRWQVTLQGIGKDYPPKDEAGFLEFARNMRTTAIYDAIKEAKPISPIYAYRGTENRLRHYEKMPRILEGLVTFGDAVCAFNPIYAQGMTVAACGALTLNKCLNQQLKVNKYNLTGFSKNFQKQLAQMNATPWMMATGSDLRWPTTEGGQINTMVKLKHKYLDRILKLGISHPETYKTFAEVAHMLKPPKALLRPKILARVLVQTIKDFLSNC